MSRTQIFRLPWRPTKLRFDTVRALGEIEVISHDEVRIHDDSCSFKLYVHGSGKREVELGSVVLVHPSY